jgi:hypothetical protein
MGLVLAELKKMPKAVPATFPRTVRDPAP